MRRLIFLSFLVVEAQGAITNVRVSGVTATQAILEYTAPDMGGCSVRVADANQAVFIASGTWASNTVTLTAKAPHGLEAGQVIHVSNSGVSAWDGWRTIVATPSVSTFTFASTTSGSATGGAIAVLVPDVKTDEFAGADQDTRPGNLVRGRSRTFVVGKRVAEVAADNRRYSRALQSASLHIYEITCGADVVSGTFRTADWPLGVSYNDPTPTDPANPGVVAWPEMSWTNRFERVVDPHTGTLIRRVSFPKYSKISNSGYEPAEALYGSGANWTNPSNALTDDATSATYSGSTQDALVLRTEYYIPRNLAHVDGLQVELKGCVADGATGTDKDIEVAFSVTGTALPYGKWLPVTLQNETGCTASAQQVGDASNPVPVMSAWLNPGQQPPAISQLNMRSGALSASGAALATYIWTGGLPFGSTWVPGSPVHVCDANPCTGNYVQYTVDSLQSTSQFTATTNFDTFASRTYKAPHFAILIRKRTASAHQVRIQYAHFRMWLTSGNLMNGGSGSTTHCSSKARADASGKLGYHCSTTNNDPSDRHIWWIAPSDGEVRFRGPVWSYGPTWNNQICSQSSMAWDPSDPANDILYCSVYSTTGKLIIIKGVLNNNIVDQGELPGGGGNSTLQWTWTNITPEPNDLIAQIKAFDPSFEETIYSVGIIGLQDGKLFFSGRAGGQNTLGWNIVFDPATQLVVGAQASWKQAPARWCGIHTSFAWTDAKWMAMVPTSCTATTDRTADRTTPLSQPPSTEARRKATARLWRLEIHWESRAMCARR